MPLGDTAEDENVEPGGFEAVSRWLSSSTADHTTGWHGPEPVRPGQGASPWGLEKLAWWETFSGRVGQSVGRIWN